MEKYDYEKEMYDDIKFYIENYVNLKDYDTKEDLYDVLSDELWDNNDITGNVDGYAPENICESYVANNLKLAFEAMREFDIRLKDISNEYPAQYIDTTIRCYLFNSVLWQVINDIFK